MNRTWRRIMLAILVLTGLCFSAIGPIPGHAAPGSTARSEPITVYLHSTALLQGRDFTLDQVASVYSSDPACVQAFARLPMGPVPVRPTLLPARIIQERVAAAGAQVVVVGDRVAILPADAIPEDQRWFYTAFLTFLEAQDAHKQGRIEIELLDLPLLLESLGTAVSPERGMASGWEERIVFEADRSPYSSGFRSSPSYESIPAGTMRVAYRVLAPAASDSAGRLAADGYAAGALNTGPQMLEGSFRIWIHNFLPVARAAVDLPADRGLSEEVVTFGEEDVSLLQSSFVVQGEELQRYKTLSSLRRGDLIDGRLLQRVLTVRAGDRVMITVARPGLRVTLPGRALRSGSIGDVVDVRPEATSKRFQARITSKGEVLVETD